MPFKPREHSAHNEFRRSLPVASLLRLQIRNYSGVVGEHPSRVNPLPGRHELLCAGASGPVKDGLFLFSTELHEDRLLRPYIGARLELVNRTKLLAWFEGLTKK